MCSLGSIETIQDSKNVFFNIFKDVDDFKKKFSKFSENDSLIIANFFGQLYAYDCDTIDYGYIEDCVLYFVKYTKILNALVSMHYTSYDFGDVNSLIIKRIIELDDSKIACRWIYENEREEYCPKEIISYLYS